MSEAATQPLVITLWETYGSNMEAVAAELSSRTGLAIHKQAYSSEQIEASAEAREKEGGFGMLIRSILPGTPSESSDPTRTLAATEAGFRDMAEENTQVVAREAAQGGIIMGRNGQYLLGKRPNTLHVKLDGPVADRVRGAAAVSNISEDRARKRQVIEDAFRADLSEKTYRFDPRDNSYYDVVVNGAGLGPTATADIILAALRAKLGAAY